MLIKSGTKPDRTAPEKRRWIDRRIVEEHQDAVAALQSERHKTVAQRQASAQSSA